MEIYDISQTLSETIPVWPGDRKFHRSRTRQLCKGDTVNVSAVTMSSHCGTHIDAPSHVDESGIDIADIPLYHFMGPARVFHIPAERCIQAADLDVLDWCNVKRVLFKTRSCDETENRPFRNYVHIAEDAAQFLAQKNLLLVGTDAPSVDAYNSKQLVSHQILLRQNTYILEGALLKSVPPGDYELVCLPLKLAGLDASPVRAVLISK